MEARYQHQRAFLSETVQGLDRLLPAAEAGSSANGVPTASPEISEGVAA